MKNRKNKTKNAKYQNSPYLFTLAPHSFSPRPHVFCSQAAAAAWRGAWSGSGSRGTGQAESYWVWGAAAVSNPDHAVVCVARCGSVKS